jgi:hypothetical protein
VLWERHHRHIRGIGMRDSMSDRGWREIRVVVKADGGG